MTPSKEAIAAAEKIIGIMKAHCEDCDYSHTDPVEDIVSELSRFAAEAVANRDSVTYWPRREEIAREEGRQSAFREAAEIAENFTWEDSPCSRQIRARVKQEGPK